MKIRTLLLICLAAILMLPMTGVCQDNFDDTLPVGRWWRMPDVIRNLGITPGEQDRLDKLYLENRTRLIDIKGEWEKAEVHLESAFQQQDFNAETCLKQFRNMQDARTRLAMERFRIVVRVREMLGLDRFRRLQEGFRLRQQQPNWQNNRGMKTKPYRKP